MTLNGTKSDIRQLLRLLLDNGVAIAINPVSIQAITTGGNRVTWKSSVYLPLTSTEFGTLEEYVKWMESGQYSALLYDGSLLQITYDFSSGTRIMGHRLLYYPCPYDIDEQFFNDLEDLSPSDIVKLQQPGDPKGLLLRSPLRFDYDSSFQGDLHPSSHLTFGTRSCRLAVVSPISLGHFVKFVFRRSFRIMNPILRRQGVNASPPNPRWFCFQVAVTSFG